MDHFDIILKLKDLLSSTCGKQVISRLIQFPLIIEYLSDPDNFQLVSDKIGYECKSWNPYNICLIASGTGLKPSISAIPQISDESEIEVLRKHITHQSIEKINSVSEIYHFADKANLLSKSLSWLQILEQIEFDLYLFADPKKKVETIFEVVFEQSENKPALIKGLMNYQIGKIGHKILSRLILNNKDAFEFVIHVLETQDIKPEPEKFVSFMKELRFLGDQELIKTLADIYLKNFPFIENPQKYFGQSDVADNLYQLQYLKNYSFLFQMTGNNDDRKNLTQTIKKVLSNLGQELGFKTHIENTEYQDEPDLYINNHGNEICEEFKRVKDIAKTDTDSAIALAHEFSKKLLDDPDPALSLFDKDHGFLIEPKTLIQFLIFQGLYSQSKSLLDKFLTQWPQDIQLIRIAANLGHDKGDHYYAAEKFSSLNAIDELTREEKKKFALSLEYLRSWSNAYKVRKTINITNDEDFRETLLSTYYAGKIDELTSLVFENERSFHSTKIASIVMKIAEKDKEQVFIMADKLDATDYANEKDQEYFCLISDYFQKNGEIDLATSILEKCIRFSKFNLSIINRLYSLYQKRGDREKSCAILNSIKKITSDNQNEIETFIEFLIHSGEIDRADQVLSESANSWDLSPKKSNLKAMLLIERGNFSGAEKLLSPWVLNENNHFEIKLNYCLAVLKCKYENFPFGIEAEKQEKLIKLAEIISLREEKQSLLKELLQAELVNDSHFEKYQLILKGYSDINDPDCWRIYAGLGRIYFDMGQFDSAIINLKRAYQIQPNNQLLIRLLIKCYANLHLWNEIESLLNLDPNRNSQSILNDLGQFVIDSNSSEWISFLENQIQQKPDEIIYRVLMAKSIVGKGRSQEGVEIIKGFYEKMGVESDLYLLCIQILIDANENLLAERLIEIFLVNKKLPSQSDLLSCAFLFEQLRRPEKALAMMNRMENQDRILTAYKMKLVFDLGRIEQYQKMINVIVENDDQFSNSLNNLKVKIPDFVKQIQESPSKIYLMAFASSIKQNDNEKAISILEKGLQKRPDDREIQFNLLEILNLTGRNESIEVLIKKLNDSVPESLSPAINCLLGEIALSRHEEIKSAQYLSEALKQAPEWLRIKALQSRIMAINGNEKDARSILKGIFSTIDEVNIENDDQSTILYAIDSKFWLAQAARDLDDNKKTLEICQQELQKFGFQPSLINLFLSALAAVREDEFILKELKAKSSLNGSREEWQRIFSAIVENRSNSHSNARTQEALINKCRLFLENDPKVLSEAEKLEPIPENINAIIYAIINLKGTEATEIAFNSFKNNENNEFFLAILEKDQNPDKSLNHLQKALQSSTPNAFHNALLAIIEKNLGNYSDAYTALNIALETYSDEYEWQIMAGDLCKLKGDLHTSIKHYQKAQSINLAASIDKKINDIYFSLGTPEAIPILEEQLSKNPNLEQTIQLGKIHIKSGNYRKALKVLESAVKDHPQSAEIYYWLSEIALNLGNPEKALGSIEEALVLNCSNDMYLCRKAEIISQIRGFSQAIKYLDEEIVKKDNKDSELIQCKVKLVCEYNGDKEGLKVLDLALTMLNDAELLLEKAFIEMRLGNIIESEQIAEKLLDVKDVKAEALVLLGSISREKGELDRAIDFYIRSIETDPFSANKFIQLAEIYHDKKEYKAAANTLEDGMHSNPGNFELLYRSSLYFYQQGGYNEAGKYIREAIRIKPGHRDSKELLRVLENALAVNHYSIVDQSAE